MQLTRTTVGPPNQWWNEHIKWFAELNTFGFSALQSGSIHERFVSSSYKTRIFRLFKSGRVTHCPYVPCKKVNVDLSCVVRFEALPESSTFPDVSE